MIRIFTCGLLIFLSCTFAIAKDGREKDNCKNFDGYVTSVLIDVSEPLSTPQKMLFEKLVDKLLDEAPGFSRFDLYRIASSAQGVEPPIISICKPWTRYESELVKGERFWKKKIATEFSVPIKSKMIEIGNTANIGKTSPLIESLFSMSVRSFTVRNKNQPIRGRVIVISDFMQHSENLSFYSNHPSYKVWRASVDGRSWVKPFDNVDVEAVVIPRSGQSVLPISGRDFFWAYFQENFKKHRWRDINNSLGE